MPIPQSILRAGLMVEVMTDDRRSCRTLNGAAQRMGGAIQLGTGGAASYGAAACTGKKGGPTDVHLRLAL